jgi:hypothetical protein
MVFLYPQILCFKFSLLFLFPLILQGACWGRELICLVLEWVPRGTMQQLLDDGVGADLRCLCVYMFVCLFILKCSTGAVRFC